MRMLRPHLASAPMFADRVERQRADGYRLLVAWRSTKAVALAGWRVQENLLRGRHLYVDDLVTCPEDRSHGLGARLLAALAEEGRTLSCTALVLDTAVENTDAQRFYARENLRHTGLHFSKSLA